MEYKNEWAESLTVALARLSEHLERNNAFMNENKERVERFLVKYPPNENDTRPPDPQDVWNLAARVKHAEKTNTTDALKNYEEKKFIIEYLRQVDEFQIERDLLYANMLRVSIRSDQAFIEYITFKKEHIKYMAETLGIKDEELARNQAEAQKTLDRCRENIQSAEFKLAAMQHTLRN